MNLTICPIGGMSNRIRNFVTAYLLCKEKGAKLNFLHEMNKDLIAGTKFDDYWEIPTEINYKNVTTEEIIKINHREIHKNNIYIRMPSLDNTYHNHWGLCIMENETLEKEGINRLKNGLNILKLKQKWENLVKNFVNQHNIQNCVGLHIRSFESMYGNRDIDQENLLISNFLSKITEKSEKIFLATDSIKVQYEMKKIFNDKMIFYKQIKNKDYLDRSSVEDFEHGLIDLYILGNCKKVYGTKGSSYSHVAGLMSKNFEWVNGSRYAAEWEG